MKHEGCDIDAGQNELVEWSDADDAVIADIVAMVNERQHRRDLRPPTRFGRTLAFWAPPRFVSSSGIDVDGFVAELDVTIRTRGMVLYDRQIVTTSLAKAAWIESIFEPDSPQDSFEVPPRAEWSEAQQRYFGLDHPLQMADERDGFTWSHLVIGLPEFRRQRRRRGTCPPGEGRGPRGAGNVARRGVARFGRHGEDNTPPSIVRTA